MSKRANYNSISKVYDTDTFAAGADVMCAFMQFYTRKTLKNIHVLDAGCGTGNYAKALIEYGIEHVTLLDASEGMLEVAKLKLADDIDAGTISDIVQVSMPPIPFPDASFDVVMFNLVLNHLDKVGDDDFPVCKETLRETKRILRPGGLIMISTILKSTVSRYMWSTQIDKDLGERNIQNSPSLEQFEEMFNATDISLLQKMNILGSDIFPNYNKNPERFYSHLLDYVNASDAERKDAYQAMRELKQRST